MTDRTAEKHDRTPGVIRADEVYSAFELRRRIKLGDHIWRQVRRELPIINIGRKQYIIGSDFIEWLRAQKQKEAAAH